MTHQTEAAKKFVVANDKSKVISGSAHGPQGGGTYVLANGTQFDLTVDDCRSLPTGYPKWKL